MQAQRNCQHEINSYGVCILCDMRMIYQDCDHLTTDEDETGEVTCEVCGEDVERR
jgi:hypothetical protein